MIAFCKTRLPLLFAVAMSVMLCAAAAAQDQPASASQQAQTTPSPAPAQAPATDDGWHFELSPYLWFPGVSGTTGVRGHNVSIHASPGDLLSHFDIGLMGMAEIRKNRFVIPLDFIWIKLEGDRTTPFDPGVSYAKLKATQTILTPGVGYRVVDGEKLKVTARVGIRYWHIGQNLSFQPSGILGNLSPSANWVDVVAGGKIDAPLTQKTVLTIFGDAGAGGANIDYQVGGLLGYRVSKLVMLQAGWRYLDVNYRNSPPQLFVYDLHQSGAIAGVTLNLK